MRTLILDREPKEPTAVCPICGRKMFLSEMLDASVGVFCCAYCGTTMEIREDEL